MPIRVARRTLSYHKFAKEFTTDMIPPHQREYVWDAKQETLFIDSIMTNMPISNGVLIFIDDEGCPWIEDGQNRLWCLIRFFRGDFAWISPGGAPVMYADFNEDQRDMFKDVQVFLTEYRGATIKERIEIFARNNTGGRPLSVGELLHSHSSVSSLIQIAKRWFFSETSPFRQRMTAVWGEHVEYSAKDGESRYQNLTIAVAIAAAILAKNINNLSKKYADLKPLLHVEYTDEQADAGALILDRLLRVYESASAIEAIPNGSNGKQLRKTQWDAGSFTGYILCAILHPDVVEAIPDIDRAFVDELVEHRRRRSDFRTNKDKEVLKLTFHHGASAARSWNRDRWVCGIKYVFLPDEDGDENLPPPPVEIDEDYESEVQTEEDDD